MQNDFELTIVMPCLNEAETLETCIRKAQAAIARHAISAEIIVADNGSTDGSQDIAQRNGARLVAVGEKGYGAALRGGIAAARGTYVLMGDADDSYNFGDLFRFVEKLRQGYDLVMGCRLPRGGGVIMPGAMPLKHRILGNPVLSFIGRLFFKSPMTDFHCGLRGFTKAAFDAMDLHTSGMEFASEMVIKATLLNMRMTEIPITLYRDGTLVAAASPEKLAGRLAPSSLHAAVFAPLVILCAGPAVSGSRSHHLCQINAGTALSRERRAGVKHPPHSGDVDPDRISNTILLHVCQGFRDYRRTLAPR